MKRRTYWKYALESPRGPTGELVPLADLRRRPATVTLLPSRTILGSALVAASMGLAMSVVFGMVAIGLFGRLNDAAYPPPVGMAIVSILACAFFAWGFRLALRTYSAAGAGTRMTFDQEELTVERRLQGKIRSKTARYDSFVGLRVNTHDGRREVEDYRKRFAHIVELVHADDFLTVPLYSKNSGSKVFDEWPLQAYAEELNLPVIKDV
eukprot:s1_g1326.t1